MGFVMENEGIDLAKIKVVGVGGGGGNALNCIVATGHSECRIHIR